MSSKHKFPSSRPSTGANPMRHNIGLSDVLAALPRRTHPRGTAKRPKHPAAVLIATRCPHCSRNILIAGHVLSTPATQESHNAYTRRG